MAISKSLTGPAWAPADSRAARGYLLLIPPVVLNGVAIHALVHDRDPWEHWVLVVLMIWPLLWRNRAPGRVFVACLAFAAVAWGAHVATVASLAPYVALYAVAALRDLRWAIAAAAAVELGLVLFATRFAPGASVSDAILFLTGLNAASLFLGTTVRAQRRYLTSLEAVTEQLRREREQEARLAASAERTRIAREMHDIVAHGLSVVITLAQGAAATVDRDPADARQAMDQVATAGRQSLDEMRRLLGVLRDDDAVDHEPQPTLATLDALLDDVRATGLAIDLRTTGDPGGLGPSAQATIYRIVQESLTNVMKHARRASVVAILLDYEPAAVRFAIQDDGAADGRPTATTNGSGLTGMRERIAMFDGALETRMTATGWLVRGELQLR